MLWLEFYVIPANPEGTETCHDRGQTMYAYASVPGIQKAIFRENF